MEKDKFRSVITLGLLVCSVLTLSALIAGCVVVNPPCTTHPMKAAFYHHTDSIPPHQVGQATVTWVVTPPVYLPSGLPAAQQCPADGVLRPCDYIKCMGCGTQLWP